MAWTQFTQQLLGTVIGGFISFLSSSWVLHKQYQYQLEKERIARMQKPIDTVIDHIEKKLELVGLRYYNLDKMVADDDEIVKSRLIELRAKAPIVEALIGSFIHDKEFIKTYQTFDDSFGQTREKTSYQEMSKIKEMGGQLLKYLYSKYKVR